MDDYTWVKMTTRDTINPNNWDYYNDKPMMTSTKPTEFQQVMNFEQSKEKQPEPKAKPELAKARTYDEGKLPLAQIPWAAIDALAEVQAYGHKKYGDFNNYRKGMEVTRNLSCALRHIRDYLTGHDVDAESGFSPLAHAFCRIAFVLQNVKDRVAIDDRFKLPQPFNPDLEEVIKDLGRQKP